MAAWVKAPAVLARVASRSPRPRRLPPLVLRARPAPAAGFASTRPPPSGGGGGDDVEEDDGPPHTHQRAGSSSSSAAPPSRPPPPGGVAPPAWLPSRLRDSRTKRQKPERLLRARQVPSDGEDDGWFTPEVAEEFEREVLLKRLQPDSKEDPEAETRFDYLTQRRRPGSAIDPEEFNFVEWGARSERPHPLLSKLDPKGSPQVYKRRCDKKTRDHIIPRDCLSAGNIPLLKEFVSESGAIIKRRSSGLCMGCQRRLKKIIKRARHLGIIPWNLGFTDVNILGFPDDDHKSRISKTI